ncbi:hypothetical protein Hanom_Chr10g00903291 [Helianthus anomalus]
MFYENHEKEFKSVIETLKKDKTELTKMVSRKQTDINLYISRLETMQKEMACVKTESDAIQLKLDKREEGCHMYWLQKMSTTS